MASMTQEIDLFGYLDLAFSRSPSPLTEEQRQLVLATPTTKILLLNIISELIDPEINTVVAAEDAVAGWIVIRKILWPGTDYES